MKITCSVLLLALPASFLAQSKKAKTDSIIRNTNEKIYTQVQELPEFPGGNNALAKFVSEHIDYPESEKKDNIKGTVVVTFVIDRWGKVRSPKVKEDIPGHPAFGKEAVRVVKLLPDWKPARHMGRNVACEFTLPVQFTISRK